MWIKPSKLSRQSEAGYDLPDMDNGKPDNTVILPWYFRDQVFVKHVKERIAHTVLRGAQYSQQVFFRISLHKKRVEIDTARVMCIGNQLHRNFQVCVGFAIFIKLEKTGFISKHIFCIFYLIEDGFQKSGVGKDILINRPNFLIFFRA